MIGKPVTAQEWNEAFRTNVGEEIVSLLMRFHEGPGDALGHAPDDIDVAMTKALEAIGTEPRSVAVISMKALKDGAPTIPGISPESLVRGMTVALAEEIRSKKSHELAALLDEWYAVTREPKFGRVLTAEVAKFLDHSLLKHVHRTGSSASFLESSYLTYIRQFNLLRCLTYQICLTIAGDRQAARTVSTFTHAMGEGINPMVLLKDRTFLVISA